MENKEINQVNNQENTLMTPEELSKQVNTILNKTETVKPVAQTQSQQSAPKPAPAPAPKPSEAPIPIPMAVPESVR